MILPSSSCNATNNLNTPSFLDAHHLCVSSRGIQDVNSSTITAYYGGAFMKEARKNEFLQYLNLPAKSKVSEVLQS